MGRRKRWEGAEEEHVLVVANTFIDIIEVLLLSLFFFFLLCYLHFVHTPLLVVAVVFSQRTYFPFDKSTGGASAWDSRRCWWAARRGEARSFFFSFSVAVLVLLYFDLGVQ